MGSLLALLMPLTLPAMPGSPVVAVVGRPGDSAAELAKRIAEAGGAIVGSGGSGSVILARSEHAGFVGRLYAAGAGLVLAAESAAGCARTDPQATTARTSR